MMPNHQGRPTPNTDASGASKTTEYLAEQIERHDEELAGLRQAVNDHDAHVSSLVADTLQTLLQQLPDALEHATERALRRVAMDPNLHGQIGSLILTQATRRAHERVGGWIFSRWGAIVLLVVVAVQYMGPVATIKALMGLFGSGGKG